MSDASSSELLSVWMLVATFLDILVMSRWFFRALPRVTFPIFLSSTSALEVMSVAESMLETVSSAFWGMTQRTSPGSYWNPDPSSENST